MVISGEIDLMLDNSVVHLKAGDTVVQQATNHAWVNRGKEICRLLFVATDAKPPQHGLTPHPTSARLSTFGPHFVDLERACQLGFDGDYI